MAVDLGALHVGDILSWSNEVANKKYIGKEAVVIALPHQRGFLRENEIYVEYEDISGVKRRIAADCKYFDMRYRAFCGNNTELDNLFCELS